MCSHAVILRHGVKIYEGRVDELIASKGYFELNATKKNELLAFLNTHKAFGAIKEDEGKIIAILNEELNAEELNKTLLEKGIYLSHLVKRKRESRKSIFTTYKK